MSFFSQHKISQNQQIQLSILQEKEVELWLKREDLIHPYVSGNKFRKLKYNLQEAKEQKKTQLLTFGGAFSNHILATAVAGNLTGFKTVGIIRGEELKNNINENSILQKAQDNGMQFHFVSRSEYREKTQPQFLSELTQKFGDFYLIPEGGTNELAVKGCEEILIVQDFEFDYICSCVGTGGTISGLIRSAKPQQQILGFPALKGNFLNNEIKTWAKNYHNWQLVANYHFGGYAKYSEELICFINDFKEKTNIALDPIYTGKMVFGIVDMIKKDFFKKGTKIVAIHSGGIQGIEGFNQMQQKKQSGLRII